MPTISLCIIVKNEEENITDCLNSVKEIIDEIIIVDTGSIDRTKDVVNDICKKFASERGKLFDFKIFDFTWRDDFSAARNESIKHATKDWILVLDADEMIANEDLIKLRELTDDACIGYYFIIRTYTDDSTAAGWVSSKDDKYSESKSTSGWFSTRLIRLFRNNKSIHFNGVIHETIDASIHRLGIVKDAPFPIHHFGRLKLSKNEYKSEFYKKLGELKINQEDNNFHSYSQLGIQAQDIGDYEKAVELFAKSIELNKNYFKSWLNLGACHLKLNHLKEAEYALKHAAALNPDDYSASNNLGIVYSKLNKPKMAIAEFLKAIELNPRNASVYFNLGLAYDSIYLKDKAYESFKKAIELNPKYGEKIKLE